MELPRLSVCIAVAAVLPHYLAAQVANEYDFDTTQLTLQTITPNGATHTIATPVTYTGQHLQLLAPIRVLANGELRLVRSKLTVRGSIRMEEGSRITVIDSSLLLENQFSGQYEFRNNGGLLHTERALIGSGYLGTQLNLAPFLHLRGTWLARQTTLQGLSTLLADGRVGWDGDPRLRGGSVFGDGVYEGDFADAIHLSGVGDAELANGTMNIGFYLDGGTGSAPSTVTVDLSSRTPLNVVYGDPLLHQGVTLPIPQHPNRLALINHRSPTWQFTATEASNSAPLRTITLRNAEDIICNFRGNNLTGSPILSGPWTTHYAELPGLPSTQAPGFHSIPPSCSVQLSNVKFQSGPLPGDWNRIAAWGLYPRGPGTNLTVTGPSVISEIVMNGGTMHLQGTRSFDMGLAASVIELRENSTLTIDNAAISGFGYTSYIQGLVEARGTSTCSITDSRTGQLRLRASAPGASITAANLFVDQNIIVDTAGGGTVNVVQANPNQNWDRQNLGFESPLLPAGTPGYWTTTSAAGTLAADPAPGAAGFTSFEMVAQAAGARIEKQLMLPPETYVNLLGSTKFLGPPNGVGTASVAQGANTATATLATQVGSWQNFSAPQFQVTSATQPTTIQLALGGVPSTVRLDDFRVHVSCWWDNSNLANLAFEGGYRYTGRAPVYWTTPDSWICNQGQCAADSTITRPGAAPGSRSMRMLTLAESAHVWKALTFLRPGQRVTMSGHVRGEPSGGALYAHIGNGETFYLTGAGYPNQSSGYMPCNGTWIPFVIPAYTVPANPIDTRLVVATYGNANKQVWVDDITVTIQ